MTATPFEAQLKALVEKRAEIAFPFAPILDNFRVQLDRDRFIDGALDPIVTKAIELRGAVGAYRMAARCSLDKEFSEGLYITANNCEAELDRLLKREK